MKKRMPTTSDALRTRDRIHGCTTCSKLRRKIAELEHDALRYRQYRKEADKILKKIEQD